LTLQSLKTRVMQENGKNTKLRFTVSDGYSIVHGVWNIPVEKQDEAPVLETGAIVKIEEYEIHQMANNKPVVLIREWEKVGVVREKIGNPVPLTETKAGPTATSTTSASSVGSNVAPKPKVAPATHTSISPIESLSPYHNKWTIRARVLSKSEVRTFHNARGEGKLFSVVFLDESGEIKATGFGEQVDALYDQLQEGQVYYVTKCRVTLAKRQFSNVQNEYELIFERDTEINLCSDNSFEVPEVKFNFVDLNSMKDVENGSLVDFVGVLKEVYDVQQITSKTTGRPYDKRDVVLVDQSNNSVRVTIWGNSATQFTAPQESVIAFKGAKVSDFNGRNLSVLQSTTVTIDPDIGEAHSLKGWYDGQGKHQSFTALQGDNASAGGERQRDDSRTTLQQVIDKQLGMSEKADYFNTVATITFVRRTNVTYPACTTEGCGKKVIQETNNHWRCMNCDITLEEPNYRYIMSFSISDHTTQVWVSCFDEVGKLIVGKPASDIARLADTGDQAGLEEVLNTPVGNEYLFRCRARRDLYSEQTSGEVRYQVVSAQPVDYVSESEKLIKEISLY
jgi:replication factor A1